MSRYVEEVGRVGKKNGSDHVASVRGGPWRNTVGACGEERENHVWRVIFKREPHVTCYM